MICTDGGAAVPAAGRVADAGGETTGGRGYLRCRVGDAVSGIDGGLGTVCSVVGVVDDATGWVGDRG